MDCWHTSAFLCDFWRLFGYSHFLWLSMHLICYYEVVIITFFSTLVLFIELFRYNDLVCVFWLTFILSLLLWLCIFCKAHLGELSNFIAGFALVLLCRAVESMCLWEVTTSSTLVWISAV